MCGIAAVFAKRGQVSQESLKKGVARLEHRGPDAQKTWFSPHGRIGLGHSRLSIIDLSTGDQPISNETGDIHIVVNGEFYEYEKIRKDLEAKNHKFRTNSDSEILLHLYEEMGTKCLTQLRGEFAFILWDEKNDLLFAGKDRFGIKPLFFSELGDTLYLASEIKALLVMGVPAQWDSESCFDAVRFAHSPSNRTLFKNVYQLPPGHFLCSSPEGTQILKYWDFNYPTAESLKKQVLDPQACMELVKAKIHEAIKIRLRADVPVGCYLSGGIDSAAVLGIASSYLSHPMKAFTLSFDRPEYDEEPIAREMAAKANADYFPVPISSSDLAENFADAIWHAETVFLNSHGVAKFLLSKAVRKAGYKVVLTGEGSDEIFAGYPHFRRDLILYNSPGLDQLKAMKMLAGMFQSSIVSTYSATSGGASAPLPAVKNYLGFVPSFFQMSYKKEELGADSILNSAFTEKYENRDPFKVLLNEMDFNQLSDRDPVNQSLYCWSKTNLSNYLLTVLGDRVEMANSIEGRVPFLDHELVELVVKMPLNLKINEMTEKYMLREIARPVVTDAIYNRPKHLFMAPPIAAATDVGHGSLFELLNDTLRGQALTSLPFFNSKKVLERLDQLSKKGLKEQILEDQFFVKTLSFCLMQQRFGINDAS